MDNRRFFFSVIAGCVCLLPQNSQAFVVGEIALQSSSTKTFQAEIPIRLSEKEQIKTVKLGSQVDYKAMGLTRSQTLDSIEVNYIANEGEARILLTSAMPLPQKSFDLLLRIASTKHTNFPVFRIKPLLSQQANAKETREASTSLKQKPPQESATDQKKKTEKVEENKLTPKKQLDLPPPPQPQQDNAKETVDEKKSLKQTPQQESATDQKKAKETIEEKNSTVPKQPESSAVKPPAAPPPRVKESLPAQAKESTPAKVVESASADSSLQKYGPIKEGDTLTSIASRLKLEKGMSIFKIMTALFERNPDQFLQSNMNNLISGGYLIIPPVAEIRKISDRQARILCMAHTKVWEQMLAGHKVSPLPPSSLLTGANAPQEAQAIQTEEAKTTLSTASTPIQTVPTPSVTSKLENVLVQLQTQLGELTQVLKSTQSQQNKLESRVTTLETSQVNNDALAGRVTALEKAVQGQGVEVSSPVQPDAAVFRLFQGFTIALLVAGLVFVVVLVWLGRRWNRQAQWSNLQAFLTVTAREHPGMVQDALKQTEPQTENAYFPTIHKGKVDGIPLQTGKKILPGDLALSVNRLNTLEKERMGSE